MEIVLVRYTYICGVDSAHRLYIWSAGQQNLYERGAGLTFIRLTTVSARGWRSISALWLKCQASVRSSPRRHRQHPKTFTPNRYYMYVYQPDHIWWRRSRRRSCELLRKQSFEVHLRANIRLGNYLTREMLCIHRWEKSNECELLNI